MPRSSYAQTDFTGGEFSPYVDARIEAGRYKTALARCLNYIPTPQGPLLRRPGSRFVHITKDNGAARLIKFKFSQTQNYVIEFGNLYCRFYRNTGLILEGSKNITAVTRGSTTVLTSNGHGYTNGKRVYVAGLVGDGLGTVPLSFLNNREYVVANVTTNTFEIQIPPSTAISSSTYDAYSSGGTVAGIYEIVSTYATADLPNIRTEQSLDTLYVGCSGQKPKSLTRTADTAWAFSTLAFTNGPFLDENSGATTLTPSAVGPGVVTITASAITGINSDTGFQTTDVGRFIRIEDANSTWALGTITARTDTTHVTVSLDTALASLAARATWRLGAWSDTTGYPSIPNFFEDRLGWGGLAILPQRLDYSRTGDYLNMLPTDADGTVGDDHALSMTLNSGDTNNIIWQRSVNGAIVAGTPAGEWLIKSAYENEPLTPTSIHAAEPTTWGSYAGAAAEKVNGQLIFVHRGKRRAREVVYDRGDAQHRVNDLSELAYHLASGGLEEFAYQQEPHQLLWVRKTDGGLLCLTYARAKENFFAAWQEHRLGGGSTVTTLTYGATSYTLAATVESMAVIPSTVTQRDELWMIVQRKIGGNTVRFVEYLDAPFDAEMTYANANQLDGSQKTTSGSNITTVSGLYYFEGETLNTWVNGLAGPDVTVTNGKFALSAGLAARIVFLGYKSTAQATLLRPEAGAADGGPALGKTRRVHKATFNFYRTLGVEAAIDATAIWDALDISGADGFTGLLKFSVSSDDDLEGRITWRQTGPEPGLIRSITGFLDTQDDS